MISLTDDRKIAAGVAVPVGRADVGGEFVGGVTRTAFGAAPVGVAEVSGAAVLKELTAGSRAAGVT